MFFVFPPLFCHPRHVSSACVDPLPVPWPRERVTTSPSQVVLSIGRFARDSFGAPTHRIPYEKMPDTRDLLELCEVSH